MKKAGKKVKKNAGKNQRPREKASKHVALVSPKDHVSAAREDTESSDERNADSSATIWTSSNPREHEQAFINTPSTSTTTTTAAIEAGVEEAGSEELLLCARCHRELRGKHRRNRSPSVDFRQAQLERSDSNSKVWFYPAAVIVLSIAVVSGVYMMLGTGDADSSEERDDVQRKQETFPEFLCTCNASHPTSTPGRSSAGHHVQFDVLHHRRRFTTAAVPLRSTHTELSRGIRVPVGDGDEQDREDTIVLGEGESMPKKRKTRRRGLPNAGHEGSLAPEKKLPGMTTPGRIGQKIVPARRRAGKKTNLAARLRTLRTLGVSGKTTLRSGGQRFKSALKSSPIFRARGGYKGRLRAPFLEMKTTSDAGADWEDAERTQSATTDDPGDELEEVGTTD